MKNVWNRSTYSHYSIPNKTNDFRSNNNSSNRIICIDTENISSNTVTWNPKPNWKISHPRHTLDSLSVHNHCEIELLQHSCLKTCLHEKDSSNRCLPNLLCNTETLTYQKITLQLANLSGSEQILGTANCQKWQSFYDEIRDTVPKWCLCRNDRTI